MQEILESHLRLEFALRLFVIFHVGPRLIHLIDKTKANETL